MFKSYFFVCVFQVYLVLFCTTTSVCLDEIFHASLCAQKPIYYHCYTTCTSSTQNISSSSTSRNTNTNKGGPPQYLVSALPCPPRPCAYMYKYISMYVLYVCVWVKVSSCVIVRLAFAGKFTPTL